MKQWHQGPHSITQGQVNGRAAIWSKYGSWWIISYRRIRHSEPKLLVCLTGTFGYGKRYDIVGKEIMHNFAKRAPVGDNKSFLPKVLDSSSLLYIKPRVIWYLDVPIFCNFPFASLVSPPSSSSTFFFSVQKMEWNDLFCFSMWCHITSGQCSSESDWVDWSVGLVLWLVYFAL